MKRITTRFVYWHNIKYQRSGHLFQDRYSDYAKITNLWVKSLK